jgi:CheY-like chemotaxis protein
LTLSRQGRTPKSPVDLNRAILSCLGAGAVRLMPAAKRGIRVLLELYPGELMVIASEAHLVRAVMNLVHNAVEAIAGEGTVVIRTFFSRLTEAHAGYESVTPGDYALVTVSDTGTGLPKGAISRLFEPFFSTKRVRDQSGTGLGLAIVHGVVKEHEGFIDVESSDQGTTFFLYFPRSDEAALVRVSTPAPRHEHAKILMVDDDPTQLRTGRRVLLHYGYDVDTLASGEQAYRSFERAAHAASPSPYDLLILDMQLGLDQDGLLILEQIRRQFPRQKAIMVSGDAPNDRIEVAVAGGIPWLVKPYSADALATAVRGALGGYPSVPVIRVSSRPP